MATSGAVMATERGTIAGALTIEAALREAASDRATTERPTNSSVLAQRERRRTKML